MTGRKISDSIRPLPISLMCLCCYLALLLSHTDFPKPSQIPEKYPSNRVHQVMVTSPLGLVPELEDIWLGHYDIPVTGDWDADEIDIINSMIADICKGLTTPVS